MNMKFEFELNYSIHLYIQNSPHIQVSMNMKFEFQLNNSIHFYIQFQSKLLVVVENVLVRLEPMLRSEILATDVEVSYEYTYPLIFVGHALLVLDRTPS